MKYLGKAMSTADLEKTAEVLRVTSEMQAMGICAHMYDVLLNMAKVSRSVESLAVLAMDKTLDRDSQGTADTVNAILTHVTVGMNAIIGSLGEHDAQNGGRSEVEQVRKMIGWTSLILDAMRVMEDEVALAHATEQSAELKDMAADVLAKIKAGGAA